MSATFMRVKGGGWINAAHVREISENEVAAMPQPEGGDRYAQLEENWNHPDNIIELTEHPNV